MKNNINYRSWGSVTVQLLFLAGFTYAAYIYYNLAPVRRLQPLLENIQNLDSGELKLLGRNLASLLNAMDSIVVGLLMMAFGCATYSLVISALSLRKSSKSRDNV